ncbi:MAG TPA: hypothetical protein VGN72_00615 [Tepidisphaeraceae bacterium]|jgi:uncharacterized membrane protein HdeD (DUF308 family)|nr:hypothetical protein [Tepidisphaeraceae bacterium]
MAKITIAFGVLLILLGAGGYALSDVKSLTAFIPSVVGVILLILGAIAAAKPQLNKHVMHAAVTIALLGFLGAAPGLFKAFAWMGGTEPARPGAVRAQAIMAVVLLVYIVLCVRSFIAARKARQAGFPVETQA